MDEKGIGTLTEGQARILEIFHRVLARESHVLVTHPELLWQQLYNRLQWEEGFDTGFLSRELKRRSRDDGRPWIKPRTAFAESKALSRTMQGHQGGVRYCSVSPDAGCIVSAGDDSLLKIWDRETGLEKAALEGHVKEVNCCVISPDNSFIVSTGWEDKPKVWEADAGVERFTLDINHARMCAVSADSQRIMTNGGGGLQVWDSTTGQQLYELHDVRARYISRDGRWCVSTIDTTPKHLSKIEVVTRGMLHGPGQYTITVWDIERRTQRIQTTLRTESQSTHFRAIDFSPDGRWMLTAVGEVLIWDLEKGKVVKKLKPEKFHITTCAFSPDGQWIAVGGFSASDNRQYIPAIQLWSFRDCRPEHVFTGHARTAGRLSTTIDCIAFSPDGRWMVSASSDETLKIWDLDFHAADQQEDLHSDGYSDCSYSQDGNWIAAGGGKSFSMWDAHSLQMQRSWKKDQVEDCASNADGSRIVTTLSRQRLMAAFTSEYWVSIWDAVSGRRVHKLSQSAHRLVYRCAGFDSVGRRVATAGYGREGDNVVIWDALSGEMLLRLEGASVYIEDLCFSPDGRWVLSAGGKTNNDLRLWHADTGKIAFDLQGHRERVQSCAFSPDSMKVVSGSWDGEIKLWEVSTGREISTLVGHDGKVTVCKFTPDGGRIISAGEGQPVRLWDVHSAKEIGFLPLINFAVSGAVHPYRPELAYCDVSGNLNVVEIMN